MHLNRFFLDLEKFEVGFALKWFVEILDTIFNFLVLHISGQ